MGDSGSIATICFKPIKVDTWHEAKQNFLKIATSGEDVFFRGQADAQWPLQSKFDRVIDKLAQKFNWSVQDRKLKAQKIERELLDEFRNACHRISGAPELPKGKESHDEFMAYAQHFGVPTRLLDWTRSPYIAAFFAFDGHDTVSVFPGDHKVAIWAFNWDKFKEYFYCRRYDKTPDEIPGEARDEFEKKVQSILRSAGPRIEKVQVTGNPNRRMVYQEGLFTRVVEADDDIQSFFEGHDDSAPGTVLTKIEIPGGEQRQALQELSLMAITPVSLMNDPDGAAATAVNAVVRFRFGG